EENNSDYQRLSCGETFGQWGVKQKEVAERYVGRQEAVSTRPIQDQLQEARSRPNANWKHSSQNHTVAYRLNHNPLWAYSPQSKLLF
ncbi:hypothetical protein KUCAC02_037073, partial [Chaenocephalus aceratus]